MKRLVPAGIAGLLLVSACAPVQYTKAELDGLIVCNADAIDHECVREKDFIRPFTPAELERLKAHIRTIRCSGCGASVDLARDMVCSFCRAPIEALDPAAVATTLTSLGEAEARRTTIDVDALSDAIVASHRRPPARQVSGTRAVDPDDLIAAGVAIVVAALAD